MAAADWRHLARTVLLVLGCVALARMVGRLDDVVGLVLLSATVAAITAPVRRRLATSLPPGVATALTAVATVVVMVVLGAVLVRALSDQADQLVGDLERRIDDLRPGTLPAQVADALDARAGLEEVFGRLPTVVVTGEEDTVGVGRRVVEALLVVVLAAFLQGSAPAGLSRIAAWWPRSARAEVRKAVEDSVGRGAGYVRRLGLVGLAVWPLAAAGAHLLGLASPLLLGVWFALWSALPWVGGWVAAAPLVGLAALDGPVTVVGAVLLGVTLAVAVGAVRRSWVEPRTVRLGAAPTAVAAICGLTAGGIGGLAVALLAAALTVAVWTSPHRLRLPSNVERDADDPVPDVPAAAGLDAVVAADDGHLRIAPGWRGVLVVLGAVAAGVLVWVGLRTLSPVAVLLAVAALLAVALDRPTAWVQRRARVPRPVAIGVVSMGLLAAVGVAIAIGSSAGRSNGSRLTEDLPEAVEDMEDLPLVGSWLAERDASSWLASQLDELPDRLDSGRDLSEVLPAVGAGLMAGFWALVLTAALLVDGPRLVAAVERRTPARHRRQAVRLRRVSHTAVAGYLAGATLVAALNATVVLIIALTVGIALAPVLAVWAFAWNFVPQIGGFMGGLPLVLLALAESPVSAAVAAVLFVAYQFTENHLIQPAIISEAIDVPAWAALLAALAGGAAAGLVGAVLLTPLVGVVRVVARELGRADFPGAVAASAGGAAPGAPVGSTAPWGSFGSGSSAPG